MTSEIVETYLPIINRNFQGNIESVEVLDEDSIEHYVFLINKAIVYRFPRHDSIRKKDEIEAHFLENFAPHSVIPVSRLVFSIDSLSGIHYQKYDYIPGEVFTLQLAASLPEETFLTVARQLGEFLTKLHTFPIIKAKSFGLTGITNIKDYGEYFKNVLPEDKKVLAPFITQKELEWIEKNILVFYELTKRHDFHLSVVHAGLLPKHILIKDGKVTGIVDFSLRISDPAIDFKFFDRYGESFLSAVYHSYLPIDKYFDERRKFYARDLPVVNLYAAITRNEPSAILSRYIEELKLYIAENP